MTPFLIEGSSDPPYCDCKRYAWLLSLLVVWVVAIGLAMMVVAGDAGALRSWGAEMFRSGAGWP